MVVVVSATVVEVVVGCTVVVVDTASVVVDGVVATVLGAVAGASSPHAPATINTAVSPAKVRWIAVGMRPLPSTRTTYPNRACGFKSAGLEDFPI